MTPTATTSDSRPSARRQSGAVRRPAAPTRPRRVSGPLRPETRPAAPTRPWRARTQARRPRVAPGAGARLLAFLRALPDHPLLDRLIRGRAWIPVLGALLAGIVFMQVEVLKLSAGMGRSLAVSTELQSQNELLRVQVAQLADVQRIESRAASMGLVMPLPAQVDVLGRPQASDAGRAARSIHVPDAATFQPTVPTATSQGQSGGAGSTATATNPNVTGG